MLVLVLFGQRKETYPGEYGPECLAVMSGYDNDENPGYLRQEQAKHEESGEFEALHVIPLNVVEARIMEILRPSLAPVPAAVVNPT